jgi:sugar diacid utilization regulator
MGAAPAASTVPVRSDRDLSAELEIELALSDVRCGEGTLASLVVVLTEMLGCVGHLVTAQDRIVSRAVPAHLPPVPIPRVAVLTGDAPLTDPTIVRRAGTDHVVAVVRDGDTVFGHLVLVLSAGVSAELALWAAGRACVHLAGEFLAQRRLARVAWNARANLGRQMIRGSSYDADLRACAEFLGVDLDADRVVVFVLERGRSSFSTVDSGRLADLMSDELGVEILPIRGTEGVLLAVEIPPDTDRSSILGAVKGAVVQALQRMGDEFAVAGLSAVTRPGQLRRAYREAREVARCLDRYAPVGTRALASDELGPARLLVANSDEHAVRTYVFDVLGGLLDASATNVALLRTLQEFFEHGRSIRETAAALDVHENTVRHRLNRVQEITGLDVSGSSNDQLSVHTAMLVLRLQGHHAVPAFDPGLRS